MPDPISIIGLITAAASTVDKTQRFVGSIRAAPTVVSSLRADLDAIKIPLQDLSKLSEDTQAFEVETLNKFARSLEPAVSSCQRTVTEIDALLRPYVRTDATAQRSTWKRMSFTFKEHKVLRLRDQLQACKNTLSCAAIHASITIQGEQKRKTDKTHRDVRRMLKHFAIGTSSMADTEDLTINDTLTSHHEISQWVAETRIAIERHDVEQGRSPETENDSESPFSEFTAQPLTTENAGPRGERRKVDAFKTFIQPLGEWTKSGVTPERDASTPPPILRKRRRSPVKTPRVPRQTTRSPVEELAAEGRYETSPLAPPTLKQESTPRRSYRAKGHRPFIYRPSAPTTPVQRDSKSGQTESPRVKRRRTHPRPLFPDSILNDEGTVPPERSRRSHPLPLLPSSTSTSGKIALAERMNGSEVPIPKSPVSGSPWRSAFTAMTTGFGTSAAPRKTDLPRIKGHHRGRRVCVSPKYESAMSLTDSDGENEHSQKINDVDHRNPKRARRGSWSSDYSSTLSYFV